MIIMYTPISFFWENCSFRIEARRSARTFRDIVDSRVKTNFVKSIELALVVPGYDPSDYEFFERSRIKNHQRHDQSRVVVSGAQSGESGSSAPLSLPFSDQMVTIWQGHKGKQPSQNLRTPSVTKRCRIDPLSS
jgi:hypothetical protein